MGASASPAGASGSLSEPNAELGLGGPGWLSYCSDLTILSLVSHPQWEAALSKFLCHFPR